MRFALELAYNGTAFHGWQRQDNACTVQEEFEQKLSMILQEEIALHGCGRTDTGVHARQYFAHFDTDTPLDERFIFHVNQILHHDIACLGLWQVPETFHSRFDAKKRIYKYFVHRKKNPFLHPWSYEFRVPLNLALMNEGCQILQESKDFAAFCKSNSQNKTTFCEIFSCFWTELDNSLIFEVSADRFLRNMVRALVGTLLDLGQERINLSELREIIASKQRSNAGKSVPAKGLFLENVVYDQTSWQLIG
jgi:tRNA pseudouridine38-40 synthase